jgi:effector-binding domain-containing protein
MLAAGGLFGVGYYYLPSASQISRSIEIERPASIIYPLLINPHHFNDYSPWFDRDPNAVYEYDGPDEGVGAITRWKSSIREVGDGVFTIIKTVPNKEARARLDLSAGPIPFVPTGRVLSRFALKPTPKGTLVTWTTRATCPPEPEAVLCRYNIFLSQMQMREQFLLGLDKLKALAESLPALDIADLEPERVVVEGRDFAFLEGDAPQGADAYRAAMRQAVTTVSAFLKQNNLPAAGAPLAVTVKAADGKQNLRAGQPFDGPAPIAPSNVNVGKTPSGPALKVLYTGPYGGMTPTYAKLDAYAKAHRLEPRGAPWEVYIDDPDKTPAAQLRTEIYFPYQNPQ